MLPTLTFARRAPSISPGLGPLLQVFLPQQYSPSNDSNQPVWERIQKLESVDLLQGVLRAMEATAGFQGHVGEVLSLAASDAGMLLSGAEDGARLWSVKVGVSSHPCAIYTFFSPPASSCPNFWEILFVLTTAGCTTTRARGLLWVWGSCRRVSRTEAASRSCTLARILQQTMPK